MSPASSVTPKTAFPSFLLLAPYFEVVSAAGWLLLFSNGTASSFFIDLPRVKRFGKLFDRYISVWLVIVHPVLLLTGALMLPIYNGIQESTTYQIEAPEKEFWNL